MNPVAHISRFEHKAKECVNVPCPSIVSTYNKFMGGVDLLDSLLSLYRIHIRSKKWYHKLFFHFLDVTVVQSWLIHCRGVTGNEGKLRLREFKMILANSLMRLANQHQQRGEGHLWLMLRSNLKQKKDVV